MNRSIYRLTWVVCIATRISQPCFSKSNWLQHHLSSFLARPINSHSFSTKDIHRTELSFSPENESTGREEALTSFKGPPVNAQYELKISIRVIGQQSFKLRILSETRAELIIDGMLKLRDEINFMTDPATGQLSFSLSKKTLSILKRFRTSLRHANYCSTTDIPVVIVRPPLPFDITLKLKSTK